MFKEEKELYEFGPFRLDVTEHTFSRVDGVRNGSLPEKAFQTLCILVRNVGHLLTKEELINQVWPDSFVEENNLDKSIHAIRNALGEKTGGQKYIETVRKHGYRFVADVRKIDYGSPTALARGPAVTISDDNTNANGISPLASIAPLSSQFNNAFEAYQQARIKYYQTTAPTTVEARALIGEALRLDPDFAPAYSLSAEVTTLEVIVGLKLPADGFPEARADIARAYELGADSADFYAAAGYVDLIADWNFAAAEKNLRKALAINPHAGPPNRMMGETLMFQGRHEEAAVYIKRAQVDELTAMVNANILAISRYLARDYPAVIEVCDRMLALSPRYIIAAWEKSWALEQMGRWDEAIAGYEKILRLPHGEPALRWIGYAYAAAGDRTRALEIAGRLESAPLEHNLSPTHLAAIYAALGESDEALRHLRKGLEIRDPFMLWVPTDPRFDNLRADPRFDQLVQRVMARTETKTPAANESIAIEVQATGLPASNDGKKPSQSTSKKLYPAVVVAVALIGALGIGGWLVKGNWRPAETPVRSAAFDAENLSPKNSVTDPGRSPAYDLYVRGKVKVGSENRKDTEAAIKVLEEAVAIDPKFAEAFAQLARGYNTMAFKYSSGSERERFHENAEVAIEKALALNPDLAEGHFSRGLILWTNTKRFPHELAIQSYKRSLALDPNLDETHHQLSMVYSHIGLLEEAQRSVKNALEINPNNTLARFRAGVYIAYQGKFDEAIAVYKTIPRDVTPLLVDRSMAEALIQTGRLSEAEAIVEDYLTRFPLDEGGSFTSVKALLLAKAGKQKEAENTIGRAVQIGNGFGHFHHTAFNVASAYAVMNKPDEAVKWLEAAAENGFPNYAYFEIDPNLNNIRKDPQFIDFMTKLKSQWERFKTIG